MVDTKHMLFKYAEPLSGNPSALDDVTLLEVWRAYASTISYHHADDSGKEWGRASILQRKFTPLDAEVLKRGLDRPDGKNWLIDGHAWADAKARGDAR